MLTFSKKNCCLTLVLALTSKVMALSRATFSIGCSIFGILYELRQLRFSRFRSLLTSYSPTSNVRAEEVSKNCVKHHG